MSKRKKREKNKILLWHSTIFRLGVFSPLFSPPLPHLPPPLGPGCPLIMRIAVGGGGVRDVRARVPPRVAARWFAHAHVPVVSAAASAASGKPPFRSGKVEREQKKGAEEGTGEARSYRPVRNHVELRLSYFSRLLNVAPCWRGVRIQGGGGVRGRGGGVRGRGGCRCLLLG